MPRKSAFKKASTASTTGANSIAVEPRKKLFDDSDNNSSEDDQDDGGAALTGGLKVNEEFAKRFEHNKKREELHRLQEKYGKGKDAGSDSESSSDDETEDEAGFLITEDLDNEISATLQAIKNKDPRIYDKNATFYKPFEPEADGASKEKKEKPVTIRDYHRERYMAGDVGAEDDTAAAAEPRTYVQEQDDLKKSIVNDFHAAAADDSEEWSDDDAFIKLKEKPQAQPAEDGMHPSRSAAMKLTEVDVVNAEKDPEGFLEKFMKAKAWAPKDGPNWQAFESDDGEDDEDIAEQFEHAYNMRFEDPDKANEVLKSYSRSLVAAKSVRKEELKGRKKLRQLEKEKKEAEKAQREDERRRLRRLKIEQAEEKLTKIKKAAGMKSKALSEEDLLKLLDDAWDDDKWEEEMKRRFGDEYYAEVDDGMVDEESEAEEDGDGNKKKKPKKPKWDDDIDIKDLIPDFEDEEAPKISLSDLDDEPTAADGEGADGADDQDSDEEDRPAKKRKTTKDIKRERQEAKREARRELAAIEALVDTKMELDQPRALAGSSGFRYRETSPMNFGMTARDILLAPSDAALNEFAGLKKLASFRDPEKKKKDKKRLGKKARLRQWRKETFGPEFERTGPTFGFADAAEGESAPQTAVGAAENGGKEEANGDGNAVDGVVDGERKKKRKRSKGKKAAKA
jgi:protein KRI1